MHLLVDDGPELPTHVHLGADGIGYASDVSVENEPLPSFFEGPCRPDGPEGPPWATVVFGLETGYGTIRERFLASLNADAVAGRDVVRYGDALESAFRETFGGRGATGAAPGFQSFLRSALAKLTHQRARQELSRGLRELTERPSPDPFAKLGATAMRLGVETGHWPPDHPSLLYWLSSLVPGWHDVHFAQPSGNGDEQAECFVIEAWCNSRGARGRADNLGDFLDVWSCAGFANVLLRDLVRSDVRLSVSTEDGGALVVAAPVPVIKKLRAKGLIQSTA